MTEVPTTEWAHDFQERDALKYAPRFGPPPQLSSRKRGVGKTRRPRANAHGTIAWARVPGVVTHVFTHFPLELVVYTAELPVRTRAPDGARWVALADLAGEAFPNVMRKVLAHASHITREASRPRRDASVRAHSGPDLRA